MSGLDAGTLERKRAAVGSSIWSNGEKSKEVTVTSRRPNVATSPRRDAPTSRRWVNNAEVNKWKRRDVPTSRRLNVAMLQRHDVSSRYAPHHLKYEWLRNQGIGRRTNEGKEFQSRVTKTSRKCPGFVLFFICGYFLILE